MNIFFYPASVSKYSKDYFKALQSCIVARDIILLPGGSGFTSPQCLALRSGDILILYAGNDHGIESLLAVQDDLKEFRILLVMSLECSRYYYDNAYKLSPIFVADPANLTEISAVIMNILLRNDDYLWSFSHSQEVF